MPANSFRKTAAGANPPGAVHTSARTRRVALLASFLIVALAAFALAAQAAFAAPIIDAKTDFTTGTNPQSVATEDFNADGRPDLAVANQGSDTVSVLLRDGSGSFGAKTDFAAGSFPQSVTTEDFNGDGHPDLAVANYFSNTVSVLLGDGSGSFGAKTDFTTGDGPSSVTTDDFDNDGRHDLAVANYNSGTVSVLLGDGSGSFAVKADFTAGDGSISVTTEDFNADDRPDLAVANQGSSTVSVLLGNGDGTFAAKTDFTTGTAPTSVTTEDFNADGRPDLAVANQGPDTVSVLLGNGDGTFGAKTDFTTGSNPRSVTTQDFNADGKPDLAVAGGGNTISVLLGDGSGSFGVKADFTADFGPTSVATEDFNADGRPDLAVANGGSDTVSILPGNGSGGFAAKTDFTTATEPNSVISDDFNGDGKPDMAVANSGSDTVSILLGDGSGSFAGKTDFDTGLSPQSVASGDFNGDGKRDLVVANGNAGTVSVLLGDGGGGFAPKADISTGGGTFSVISEDFDGDGKSDLAVVNYGPDTVSILLGDGSGGFGPPDPFSTGTLPTSVTSGDFNGDGKPDLAVANSSSNSVSVLLGIGDGSFDTKTDFTTGGSPRSIASDDFNGDGKPDLAVANISSGGSISVLLGDGSGSFADKTDFTSGFFPKSITTDDINGDGMPDLVVGNEVSDSLIFSLPATVSVLLGDGGGGFADRIVFTAGVNPRSVISEDFNGDGKPDVAVANFTSNDVSVLLGDGRPSILASDSEIAFGRQGADPAVRTTKLRNGGTTSLRISSASITGTDAADFEITGEDCSGEGIPVTRACAISVRLDASAEGFKRAELTIASNAPGSPLKIPLTGFWDVTAPTATINSGPPDLTNDTTPTFEFSADENAGFECRVFKQFSTPPAFSACSGPGDTHTADPGLSSGDYSFQVRATDNASNTDIATHTFSVDAGAPNASINTGPGSNTNDDTPTFGFSADGTPTFMCRLFEQGSTVPAFSTCSGPGNSHTPESPLSDRQDYIFEVQAIDTYGNESRASRNFSVATASPETSIESGPSGPTSDDTPTFTFLPGAPTFECRISAFGAAVGPYEACSGPGSSHTPASALAEGNYRFEIRAADLVGNSSTASRDFTVDTTAPDTTIDSGPSGPITTDQATFTFSGDPAADTAKVQCQIDGEPFADCTSPTTFTGLSDGPHTASFRAEDAAGNQDATPATRSFTVDTTVYKAKISKVSVKGPSKVKKGKKANYKVKISNSGNADATGVRLKVSGKGLSFNTSVGKIAAGKTRTVKVKVKPKKPGKVKASFKVTSKNAGGKTVKKTITVKK